jgi:hypothetical protein
MVDVDEKHEQNCGENMGGRLRRITRSRTKYERYIHLERSALEILERTRMS